MATQSILDGALAALQTGQQVFNNQYNTNRQREQLKIAREQQDILNTEESERLRLKGYRETLGNIAQHTGNVTEEQNWAKLFEERPDLIVNLSNQRPEYNVFTKADGTEERAELVGYDKRGDIYVPMVKRFDTGEVVPMTGKRTELGKDNVVQLTQDEFNDHLKSRWEAGISKGALRDNDGVLYTGAKTLNEWTSKAFNSTLREASLDIVGNDAERSPAQKSEFYKVINETDDIEALKKVYESLGGDVDALLVEADAAAAEAWAKSPQGQAEQKAKEDDNRTPISRALNPRNRRTVGKVMQTRMDILGITDPEEYDRYKAIEKAVEDAGINAAGGKTGYLFKRQSDEELARNTAAENFYDVASNRLNTARAIFNDPELKKEFDKLGPLAFFEKYGKDMEQLAKPKTQPADPSQGGFVPKGTTPGSRATTSTKPQIATRPPFELTEENIREAIRNQTEKPTQEQINTISAFLDSKGIETDAELVEATKKGEVAPEDARFVAYVMGMTHSGTSADKMALTQKLLNGMQFGDMDVGMQEASNMAYNQQQSAMNMASLELRYNKHRLDIQKYDNEQGRKIIEDTQDWANRLFAAVGYMKKNDDGEYEAISGATFDGTAKQATDVQRLISQLIPKLRQSKSLGDYGVDANGDPIPSPQSQAYMDRLNPALNFYVQALAYDDDAGFFDGRFYKDFFRPNADGTTDFDLKRIRIAEKGPNDSIRRIAYVDEDGVNSQEIDMSDIQSENPIIARLLAEAAMKNGMVD